MKVEEVVSTPTTESPLEIKISTNLWPKKPEAPVTKTFFTMLNIVQSCKKTAHV
jgi:hypothetical protein